MPWKDLAVQRAYMREYRKTYNRKPANKEKARISGLAWYHRNKDKSRAYVLAKKYGLSREEYQRLFIEQDGRCAICRVVFDKTPHTDHDHITGKARALLCSGCNRGLGYFGDDPFRLQTASAYVQYWIKQHGATP